MVWSLGSSQNHDLGMLVARAGELMPSVQDYEELEDDRGSTSAHDLVSRALQSLVDRATTTPGEVVPASLAGVVRAEALVTADAPRRLHLRFRVSPLRRGVLPGPFHWILVGGLPGADPATISESPSPGAPVPQALTIRCDW